MTYTLSVKAVTAGAMLALLLSDCSSSGSNPQPVTTANPLLGKLQLAVGTANIFGDLGGAAAGSATGLNVVTTFRQVAGQQTVGASATLVNTPALSGPMTLPAPNPVPDNYGATLVSGPTPSETTRSVIAATAQPPAGTYPVAPSSFGVSNGAFSSGIEPFNGTVVGGPGALPAGQPVSFAPNVVPAYDPLAATGDPNAFVPFGGPPAFDLNKTGRGTRDGLGEPSTQLGIEEGLNVFQGVVPGAGTYVLNVIVPALSANLPLTATGTLQSTALLPAIAPPATVTTDGNGGLSAIPVTVPAGVTEAYVQITDTGPPLSDDPSVTNPASCNGSDVTPTYYTLRVAASGTYTLAANLGPVGKPTSMNPSLCTAAQNTAYSVANVDGYTGQSAGDQFSVQLVGFDYPAYPASPARELRNPTPVLTGARGQADITISSAGSFAQPAGALGPQPLSRRRAVRARGTGRRFRER